MTKTAVWWTHMGKTSSKQKQADISTQHSAVLDAAAHLQLAAHALPCVSRCPTPVDSREAYIETYQQSSR